LVGFLLEAFHIRIQEVAGAMLIAGEEKKESGAPFSGLQKRLTAELER